MSKNIYYVYVLLDPTKPGPFRYGKWVFQFEPFYVGKGKRNRASTHATCADACRNKAKDARILKLQAKGKAPIVVYKKRDLEEWDALKIETAMIAKIGRTVFGLGPLLNISPGGAKGGGKKYETEEQRKSRGEAISEAKRKFWQNISPERREEIRLAVLKGKRKALKTKKVGSRKKEAERRRKISEYWKNNPEAREKRRRKFAASMKRVWSDPAKRAKHSRKLRRSYAKKSPQWLASHGRRISQGKAARAK